MEVERMLGMGQGSEQSLAPERLAQPELGAVVVSARAPDKLVPAHLREVFAMFAAPTIPSTASP